MGIGGPRVGIRETWDEVPQLRRGRRPQPECAVDVNPGPRIRCAVLMRNAGRFADVIESPGMHVAGLQADDRRAAPGVELRGERSDVDPALVVGRHRRRLTQAEVAQCDVDGAVPLCTDDHPNRRAAVQALRVDVPAHLCEHLVAGGSQTGEVRHRRAGDEPDVGARGQPEQLEQPATRRLLRGGSGGRRVSQCRCSGPTH